VIDSTRTKPFFGLPVQPPDQVTPFWLDGQSFDRLVVMSFETRKARATLEKLELGADRVFWI